MLVISNDCWGLTIDFDNLFLVSSEKKRTFALANGEKSVCRKECIFRHIPQTWNLDTFTTDYAGIGEMNAPWFVFVITHIQPCGAIQNPYLHNHTGSPSPHVWNKAGWVGSTFFVWFIFLRAENIGCARHVLRDVYYGKERRMFKLSKSKERWLQRRNSLCILWKNAKVWRLCLYLLRQQTMSQLWSRDKHFVARLPVLWTDS